MMDYDVTFCYISIFGNSDRFINIQFTALFRPNWIKTPTYQEKSPLAKPLSA